MNIDVSVIVPIYNMQDSIKAGIKALLEQKDVSMEVILVDDGSKDDSGKICERCISGHPEFTYIRTENQGSGPARNVGIARAKGEYLYFFDIDDTMEPNALHQMVQSAKESGCDLLVFGYSVADGKNAPHSISPTPDLVRGEDARKDYLPYFKGNSSIQGAPWNKLFRRDVIEKYHIEYPALRRHQDEVFIMRYMDKTTLVRLIPNVLYHYRSNTLERMWLKYRLDYDKNVEMLFDYFDQYVLRWNPDNEGVKKQLYLLYYLDILSAMKGLYNPKWNLSHVARYRHLKTQVKAFCARAQRYTGGVVPDEVKVSGYWKFITKGQCLPLYFALLHVVNKK